jgi:hypothetical protein
MVLNDETVPSERTLADYFWWAYLWSTQTTLFILQPILHVRFGQIIYFDQKAKKMHLRWFEHASRTIMQELGRTFLKLCGN